MRAAPARVAEPVLLRRDEAIARGTGPIVELDASHDEDAAARHEVLLRPGEPVVDERADARLAAGLLQRGGDDERDEALDRLVEDRDLEVLLGGEVGEEAALRHPHVLGELADGDALEADLRRERQRRAEDRRTCVFALGHHGYGIENRTIVLDVKGTRETSIAIYR